ncbi:MAG TPA: methyltransferase [Ilumatobacteraceae bacterium]|jgi:16S rRNA (guanine1207-N2)-methyltransferase|nr:methyltransferase [Ilumatobacteraceae bacterium]
MGHYFDEDPTAPSSPRDVELWLPDMSLKLTTDRGVFGYGQIDAGTKLLLMKAPPPPSTGNVLDLGCGVGTIALPLARRAPGATVWAIDVNGRARDLCAANATANDLSNVRVVGPDDVPAEVAFDCMWSNPPIRIGKPALHDLLLQWLPRLTPDGYAILVVQKHLGADSLQRWLIEQGYPTERTASSSGYRILRTASATGRLAAEAP